MSATTASTSNMKSLSIADIERAMREIDLLPKNKDWLLMDPNGNCWKTDDVAALMGILAAHHPMLRHPMTVASPFDVAPIATHKEGA